MSHPYPVTSIKYCVNVSNKINFARYQREKKEREKNPIAYEDFCKTEYYF